MKFLLLLNILLAALLLTTACASPSGEAAPSNTAPAETEQGSTSVFSGKILSVSDGTLLIAGMGDNCGSGQLYTLFSQNLPVCDASGAAVNTALTAGMLVEIAYNGTVLESYPAQLGGPSSITILENEGSMVGMYLEVISELQGSDTALNEGISFIAFDLTGVTTLSESEQSGFIYLAATGLGLQPLTGTYAELCDQGYINPEKNYFEDGLLYTISDTKISESSFLFSISKWRGGSGAMGYSACSARLVHGRWDYKLDGAWIS